MNINFQAPINSTGYGVAGLNLLRALDAAGHEVSLFPIHMDPAFQGDEAVVRSLGRAQFYDIEAPSVRLWHQYDLAPHVGFGMRTGITFFELDRLKPHEVHQLNALHKVCVASEWGRGVAQRSGVAARPDTELHVVPLGVDRTVFHETIPHDNLTPDTTVFFNVGKWEIRKGHDVLLQAFNRAFSPADKVLLRMVSYNPFLGDGNRHWYEQYLGSPMGAAGRIQLFDRLPDQAAVAAVMAASDCGVFPARAEAWNLDLLEAMSCGKVVIATRHAGHTEFCTDDNSMLIDVAATEPAIDNIWFHGEGEWASLGEAQEAQLIEYLRAVHRTKQAGGLCINEAGIVTARQFGWQRTAATLVTAIGG